MDPHRPAEPTFIPTGTLAAPGPREDLPRLVYPGRELALARRYRLEDRVARERLLREHKALDARLRAQHHRRTVYRILKVVFDTALAVGACVVIWLACTTPLTWTPFR